MTARVELAGVRKAFNEDRSNAFWAVDGVDLSLPAGGVTVVAGPSGSGKTTLLTLIGCLARPTEGRVRLDGRDISGLPEPFRAALRRRTFGFVFQRFNLIRGLPVLENVMLPAYPLGTPRRPLQRRALELLERLGLEHRSEAHVESLSGGEAQRTAIARALINDPPVLIADEPTANLDSALSRAFLEIVAALRDEGRTLLLSSHDPLVREAAIVDRVIELRDGRVIADRARRAEPR
ncbi:antimicrobial peptide ABC transporter ATPase [Thioalkalivibrio nitratireducens DSM 14787]|uniref:Antimicrobial peptide ABC transporter ATPase n=1 Tax=Thioalkalivibrio nitratireducens (strain DSM 14787 / UNIQEM 213 / ALEN2) TaxID=1255043 RepID=L0DT78_THIND|nr:ABC transporter ATP-binding protein [Thioalkalivibrio nitratireducens]AGA32195.1 antimicrobial peptide ABC transporter ATPase [Thioalkalivibrio nitratireducens DSM 14787]